MGARAYLVSALSSQKCLLWRSVLVSEAEASEEASVAAVSRSAVFKEAQAQQAEAEACKVAVAAGPGWTSCASPGGGLAQRPPFGRQWHCFLV